MSRYVTISSLSSSEHAELGQEELLARSIEVIREAAGRGADVLVFPEAWCQLPLLRQGLGYCATSEAIPGPHSAPIMEACAASRLPVLWPMFERRREGVFNTALFIGADGKALARRDKLYLTDKEIRDGVRHGRVTELAALPFGRVGSAICFDANFRDVWSGLKADGAELVLFPSMFQATRHLSARGLEFGYYILTALTRTGAGQLFGQCGELLEQAGGEELLVARINLERRVIHMDNNYERAVKAITAKYGDSVRVERIDSESRFALEVIGDGPDVTSIMREFAMEPLDAYYRRMEDARAQTTGCKPC
jgi:predicted amidohydrolase